ncbi:sensor domain-containing diguanylate cyclase [Sulfurimonas marina]|nr:sensor domain-containing diguanylate cyclase [Sulfurimonas marina]
MFYIILVLVFLIIFIYLRFRKQQQKLIEAKEKYKSIVEDLGENFFAYRMDAEFNFVYFSKNMENILGVPPQDVLGKNFDNMLEWTGDSIEVGAKSLEAYYTGKQQSDLTMMSFIHPITGKERFIRVADHAVHDSSGNLLWIEGILEDITDRINAEKELQQKQLEFEKLATTDILTGVYNRYSIMKQIKEEMRRIKRKEEPLSLIMYDYDHFKDVNDNFGHDIGDYVLKETTKIISQGIREIDKIGRYGGEEFLILLPYSNLSDTLEVAQRIKDAVASHHFKGVKQITISLGVAQYNKGESLQSLLKRIDEKMYQSKHLGRNRVSS